MDPVKLTNTLISKYKDKYPEERPYIIGIDGLGGSGKTTLAMQLQNEFKSAGCETFLVHIDNYIVQRENRYETGFEEWYEYYHLQWDVEMIQAELFDKLSNSIRQLTLPYYDKSSNTIQDQLMDVPPDAIMIIEGVFIQRKEWQNYFDYMIFLDCSLELRSKRVLARDRYLGDNQARIEKYKSRYWLAEDYYLQKVKPIENADYLYRGM
ncbi:kinase [Jeotgalibacillus sp. ET6]|uniref:kinase n=1 Tax=Jeotgalibacillus sp. ET6 TaxID=3037260 RepID=UPI0024189A6C|nr:kinase [Jeotgalibacillus sp. ET6]MDG5471282.1 kinase [Jeotgalibacillus sp. ET6]